MNEAVFNLLMAVLTAAVTALSALSPPSSRRKVNRPQRRPTAPC